MHSVRPKVSITTPTLNREAMLPAIHQCVLGQTVTDWEWIVVDDSPQPSAFLTAQLDPRIRYLHVGRGLTVGEKRNLANRCALADTVAHFDDDDYYSPGYLDYMLGTLDESGADMAKLGAFFIYSPVYQRFAYWDLLEKTGVHFIWSDQPVQMVQMGAGESIFQDNHLGYGFSYVYRKKVWQANPFAAVSFNEDTPFLKQSMAQGFQLELRADSAGLCVHFLHNTNTSVCFPQYVIPFALVQSLFPHLPNLAASHHD